MINMSMAASVPSGAAGETLELGRQTHEVGDGEIGLSRFVPILLEPAPRAPHHEHGNEARSPRAHHVVVHPVAHVGDLAGVAAPGRLHDLGEELG
jgi:hypothetical protein